MIVVSPTVIAPRTKTSAPVRRITAPRHSIQSPGRAGATNSQLNEIVATHSASRSTPRNANAVSAESAKAVSAQAGHQVAVVFAEVMRPGVHLERLVRIEHGEAGRHRVVVPTAGHRLTPWRP